MISNRANSSRADDLRVVQMGQAGDLRAIQSNQQDLIIGQAPRAPIPAGTVLNTGLFVPVAEAVPAGRVVVGAVVCCRGGADTVASLWGRGDVGDGGAFESGVAGGRRRGGTGSGAGDRFGVVGDGVGRDGERVLTAGMGVVAGRRGVADDGGPGGG